jgi:hypothetical protein
MTRMNSNQLRFRSATQRDCDTQSQYPLSAGSVEGRQADPKRKPEAKVTEEPRTTSAQGLTVITSGSNKDDSELRKSQGHGHAHRFCGRSTVGSAAQEVLHRPVELARLIRSLLSSPRNLSKVYKSEQHSHVTISIMRPDRKGQRSWLSAAQWAVVP